MTGIKPTNVYPDVPGFRVPGTSEEAAEAISRTATTLRDQVLHIITAAAPHGLTADEVANQLNKSILSVRPRVSELLRQGEIRRLAGARGKNSSGMTASKWIPSPPLPGPEPEGDVS